jgi:hypothetical protein
VKPHKTYSEKLKEAGEKEYDIEEELRKMKKNDKF